MKPERRRKLRLLVVIALVGVGLALSGCVEEDQPDEDDVVAPGETNNGGGGGGGGGGASSGDRTLNLTASNETYNVSSDLVQPPPDPQEAGLSQECSAQLAGHSWSPPDQTNMPNEPPLNPRELEVMIHETVNSIRESQGKEPLYCDNELRRLAIDHGENMEEHGFVGDTDHEGLDPLERMWYNDYQCDDAGQNHMVFVYQVLVRDQKQGTLNPHLQAIGEMPLGAYDEYRVGPGESGIVSFDMTAIETPNEATRKVVNSGWFQVDQASDIMLGNYTRQGIGVNYNRSNNVAYVTQMLC